MKRICGLVLAMAAASCAPKPDAAVLLAKASAAFEHNDQQEVNWNWNVEEDRWVLNKRGRRLQTLPSVTLESLIRKDGRRCNAVLAWSDGIEPYLARGDPDARCQAIGYFRFFFSVPELFKSSHAKVVSQSDVGVMITIPADRERSRSPAHVVSCAASIEATVLLDRGTFFPRVIDGKVAESGCDVDDIRAVDRYEHRPIAVAHSTFRKGSVFRVAYELQPDRFPSGGHSFWIRVREHYDSPREGGGSWFIWGRHVPLIAIAAGQRLVKDMRTTAQEFGANSKVLP
ncbi:MAG TPA: hypothetical protein VKU01_29490 [Bryobacteraceae bacterium]|nr:hypothetical protein [Bryobacteraceae bacterium]